MNYFINLKNFNPVLTLTGGQAFRWRKLDNCRYFGIAGNRAVEIFCTGSGIKISSKDLTFWSNYFDAETDYNEITECFSQDATLRKACEFAQGLRLLRQEPFETLISFIISQNNNISRIKNIIGRLCAFFGEQISDEIHAFPSAETLAAADLSAIGAGYRAGYINDAARKVQSGEINLDALFKMQTDEARGELLKIKGVGEKVADCVLLFAFGKHTFPKDVHIKRALGEFYSDGLPACVAGYEGIAQQYLFEYYRNIRRK
jgi:N-glycosylase/DNA lyase